MKKYKDFEFFGFSDNLMQSKKLEKVAVDSDNWLRFYQNQKAKWIEFYPFSEYHGGGPSYIINIGSNDFDSWLKDNPDFIASVRGLITK